MLTDDMLNAWCVYWPPGGQNNLGEKTAGTPVACRCNWATGGQQAIVQDGVEYMPNHSVYLPIEVAMGGSLWLVPRGTMASTASSDDVLAIAPPDPPSDSRIKQVATQADLDDDTGTVHKALV